MSLSLSTPLPQTGSLIGAAPPPDAVDMLRRATASPFDNLVGALDGPGMGGGPGGGRMMPDPIGPSGPGGPPPQYGMGPMGGAGGGGYYPYSGQLEADPHQHRLT